MNKYLIVFLIVLAIWGGYLLAQGKQSVPTVEPTPQPQSVPEATDTTTTSPTPPETSETSSAVSPQQTYLNQCIAEQTKQYDNSFVIQTCAQYGYTKDDYEQGRCQVPFPDVQQVMLIQHKQKLDGIAACEKEFGQ